MARGKTLVSPDTRSPTKRELSKRAQELGVEGRSRMSKAALADAVARKEMGKALWATAQQEVQSAAQQVQDAVRAVVQQEVQSAMQQVRGAVRSAAQPAARQVREAVREVVRQEALSAARQVRDAVRATAQQEAQSAVWEVAQSAAQDSEQVTAQPNRATQQGSQSRFRRIAGGFGRIAFRFGRAALLPVTLALITSLVTSNYVSSRVFDRAFRGGTDPVSSKVIFDRDNGVQGLTWALHGSLGKLSEDEGQLLAEATAWYIDMTIFVDDHSQYVTIGFRRDRDRKQNPRDQKQNPFEITALIDLQDGKKGSLAAYNELYVLDRDTNPAGFTLADPQGYVP